MKNVLQFLILWLVVFLIVFLFIVPNTSIYQNAMSLFDDAIQERGIDIPSWEGPFRHGFAVGYILNNEKVFWLSILLIQSMIAGLLFFLFKKLPKSNTKQIIMSDPIESIKNLLSNILLFIFGVFNYRASNQLELYFNLPIRSRLVGFMAYIIIFIAVFISNTAPRPGLPIRFIYISLLQFGFIVIMLVFAFFNKSFQKNHEKKLLWLSIGSLIIVWILSMHTGIQLAHSDLTETNPNSIFKNIIDPKAMAIVMLMVLAFSFYFEVMKQVALQKTSIDAEMNVAKRIQDDLLPIIDINQEHFSLYGWTESAYEVGGDYCDFVQLHGNRYVVAVGDVSGHNVAAGLMMSMLKVSFRTELNYMQTPEQTVQSLNKTVFDHKNKSMFISFLFTLVDPIKKQLTLMNCGHLPLLHFKSDDQKIEHYRTGDVALGLQASGEFKSMSVPYTSEDLFVFLSDGLVESTNKANQEFDLDHVCQILNENSKSTPKEVYYKISHAEKEFRGKNLQQDDITIVVMKMA